MLRRHRRHRWHRHPGPIQGRLQAAAPHVHGQDGRDHRTSYIVYIGIKNHQNIKGFRKIDWLELDRIGWNWMEPEHTSNIGIVRTRKTQTELPKPAK